MGMNLTGIFGSIGNLASSVSAQDVLTGILTTTAGTVVLSGLQSPGGQDAVDPLHLFHKPATASSPAATGVVSGPGVMPMSKFLALTPDQQKVIEALNYTIIPG